MFGQSLLSGAFGTALVPDENFNTVLYIGNASVRSINVGFKPDLTWIKDRTTNYSHVLIDSVRGPDSELNSNDNSAEYNETSGLTAFTSTGFDLGTLEYSYNKTNDDYVSWNWKAGGAAVQNNDGTINGADCMVSANPDAGFSIVKYSGTGSAATFGHGLSNPPEFVLIKSISNTENWFAWSKDLTAYSYELSLNGNGAEYNSAGAMFAAAPTSTLLSIGTDGWVNGSGQEYICYAWRSIASYSKIGTYTGDGNTSGHVITTGFEPSWIMFKPVSVTGYWYILDNKRSPVNPRNDGLFPNDALAEIESTNYNVDFLSTGFELKNNTVGFNQSGADYIYVAFA
jgi:hypothetical protein